MPRNSRPPAAQLGLEQLEARLAFSSSALLQESFDNTSLGSLPSGWSQWSSSGDSSFGVSNTRALGGSGSLASSGRSNVTARAWQGTLQPADVQVSAAIYLDSLIPVQILARGQNLNGSSPSYYAVAIRRGLYVQLLRVANGTVTSLGDITSPDWFEGRWAQVTLSVSGNQVRAQVYRADTQKFLNSAGQWQSDAAWAIERTDSALSGSGLVGIARPASYAGNLYLDNFSVVETGSNSGTGSGGSTNVQEAFDSPLGALPSGWLQWSSSGASSFWVSNTRAVSGSASLVTNGISNVTARAWLASTQPADVQVSAAVYLDSLIPVQILARGQNLNGSSPSYYAVAIRRGLYVQLVRVTNGTIASLGDIASTDWFEGRWAQVTLSVSGNQIRAQIFRADTQKYLNAAGQWQSEAAWAINRSDSTLSGSGLVGISRPASYAGNVYLDNFSVVGTGGSSGSGSGGSTTVQESFDSASLGSLPSGWSQWSSSGTSSFGISNTRAVSGSASLASSGLSNVTARAWLGSLQPADVQVSAAVYLDSLIPMQILARGQNLNGSSPSYYAVASRRGLYAQLVRVVNGTVTSLGEITSPDWFEGRWAQVTLSVSGTQIRAQVYRADTQKYLNSSGQWQSEAAWALERSDSALGTGGLVGMARPASYAGVVYVDNFVVTPLSSNTPGNPPPSGGLTIPRHYSHIRLAQLAYSGLPLGSFEDQLLRNSIDLVVTDVPYLSNHIDRVAPDTPQLAYINFSSIYLDLLTDWLSYADKKGLSRESAFYHVAQATPFSGDSPSSQPVNWFWRVFLGGQLPDFKDLTTQAHLPGGDTLAFGSLGQSTYLGYPENFREINVDLASGAGAGWSAVLEYASAVDAFGNPTAWSSLRLLSDSTNGLKNSGKILFNPPGDWKPASLNGTPSLYYVRIRTITTGLAPVANTVLGRDYVNAQGGTAGVIPAFDAAADANRDGYLDDNEYARRAAGKDARFVYESRLFFGSYGQMRFTTNPSATGFRNWAVDYSQRYLAARPLANGLFVDNSVGSPLVNQRDALESIASYANDYGSLLNAIGGAIAPSWVLANTAGGGTTADGVIRQNTAYYEEFALRPLANTYRQFEDMAALIAHRAGLQSPAPYAVLDSLPTGGSPTDPRTQIATLAYYYLVADPERTFLNFYGGYEPATSWSRHWSQAVTFDVGQATGTWSLLASGADPNDWRFSYRVYQRSYTKALILYKPLSSDASGTTAGSLSQNTATTHQLNGSYRPLRADGTLGAALTSITLRNGEGAILIRA